MPAYKSSLDNHLSDDLFICNTQQTQRIFWPVVFGALLSTLTPLAIAAPTINLINSSYVNTDSGNDFGVDDSNPSPNIDEVYAEVRSRINPGKWFGSAKADNTGNLEVGVVEDKDAYLGGDSEASAFLAFNNTYESGPQYGGVEFTVQQGEILFDTTPGYKPGPGLTGSLEITLTAYVGYLSYLEIPGREQPIAVFPKTQVAKYFSFLKLTSTNTGFEIDPSSSSSGLLSIEKVLSGDGGLWGVQTKEFSDVLLLPELATGETLRIEYEMIAKGANSHPDSTHGLSVRIGDPLHLTEADSQAVFNVTPAAPVPLPGAFWLFASALFGVFSTRRR